jgi:monothiol glutaredoxin
LITFNKSIQSITTEGAETVEPTEIEAMIKKELQDAEVIVDGEGCSFSVIVVSARFDGCTLLKKQQMVLDSVKEPLATGELHAITVKAYTPGEWARR